MKLYDVIRKEDMERGTPLKELPPEVEVLEPKKVHRPRKKFVWRKVVTVGLVAVFVALLYVAGMKMVRTTVDITERRIPFSLDSVEFELVHEADTSTGRLSFQTMVVPDEVSRQVYGSEIEPSTSSAKGKVVFFNEYSTKSQTVKAGTVIVGANKKKYKTLETATVPGYTIKDKAKVAGTSLATAVVASAVGPDYNTDGTSFTVTGWSGTKAKQFYAQSAGAITGGEDGVVHTVSATDQGDIVATLQAELIERLKRDTRTQIPDDLITFPDLQVTTVDNDSLKLKGDDIKFPASVKGTMVTYLISRDLLEAAIANHVRSEDRYAHVTIPELGGLTVTPVTALPTDPNDVPDVLKIRVSGEGTIITNAPVDSIKESLVGAPKQKFAMIMAGIPEVASAQYHFYPFWAPFFPNKDSRITIKTQ